MEQRIVKLIGNITENTQIKEILNNIKNNIIKPTEIIHLAKYGAYHNNVKLVKTAYICGVDLHTDDDFLFRMAIKQRQCKLLFLLLSLEFEYFEKNYFNKKYDGYSLCKYIIDIITTPETNDCECNGENGLCLTDQEKNIFSQILLFALDNDLEIKTYCVRTIFMSCMEEQIIYIINKNNNFCDLLFQETYSLDILCKICDSPSLFKIVYDNSTIVQIHQLISYYLRDYQEIQNIDDIMDTDDIVTPEFIYKLFSTKKYISEECFNKLLPLVSNKQRLIDSLPKLIDPNKYIDINTGCKPDIMLIMFCLNCNILKREELIIMFNKKYISACEEWYDRNVTTNK